MSSNVGLDRIVVSIVHCGCTDPGSIPGLDSFALCSNILLVRNMLMSKKTAYFSVGLIRTLLPTT